MQRELTISIPVSPDKLVLELKDKRNKKDTHFVMDDFQIEKIESPKVWASPERHRFMEFAINFAQKAGHVPAGFYASPNQEFLIQYLTAITDGAGREVTTPARIHRKMPRVQLSQRMFKKMSIPVRVAILAHEGCHFFMNTRSEKEADLCGIKYYLDYGFPTIEAVYAATKVFMSHPTTIGRTHLKRTQDIIGFINQYKAKQEQKDLAHL